MKPYRGPPMSLGVAAAAKVRLIVWCKACQHQVEPDPAEETERYGARTPSSIGAASVFQVVVERWISS
jgi:hypothetical protein